MSRLAAIAAFSGAIAVIAGAFGAHGVTDKPAEWLKTGAEYQMVHAVAALIVARLYGSGWSASLLLAGSILFAATLYVMALGGPRWLGAVTPIGGAGMIAGWIVLGVGLIRANAL